MPQPQDFVAVCTQFNHCNTSHCPQDGTLNYPPDGSDYKYLLELRAEAEYYGLTGLVEQIDRYPVRASAHMQQMIHSFLILPGPLICMRMCARIHVILGCNLCVHSSECHTQLQPMCVLLCSLHMHVYEHSSACHTQLQCMHGGHKQQAHLSVSVGACACSMP